MKASKLSSAIKLVLAAQIGASAMAFAPLVCAQQTVAQPQWVAVPQQGAVYNQGAYVMQQRPNVYQPPVQQVVYVQPQTMAPQQQVANYSQGSYVVQQQPQPIQQQVVPQSSVYQPPAPQQPVMYVQPQGAAQPGQQVMYAQPAMWPQPAEYPQGTVVYPQAGQYGNVVMQAPAMVQTLQAGVSPQGMVAIQQGAAPVQQAPMLVYQNGVPVQNPGGLVYTTNGQLPQGAVVYPYGNGVPQAQVYQAAATMAGSDIPTTVLPAGTDNADENLIDRPRIQTGSLSRPDSLALNRMQQTLTGDELRSVNAVNVESALNTLPQVVPGLDRSSNNPGNGRATVNLRGLGSERTAVLVNGRPFAQAVGDGRSDLNAIPQALIKQVDVATGGASVAYGSGAVSGAVNFILDENFQGAELNVSRQSSAEGDAALSSADLTLGAAFAGGKGNIAVSVGGSERDELFRGARDFSTFLQVDSTDANGNPVLIPGGSSGVPGTSIFSGALGSFSPSFGVTFDPDGQIRPFETGEQNDFYNYAPVNYLQIPQTRQHATAIANLEIGEGLELYGLGMYSENETAMQLAPIPIFQNNVEFTLDESPFLTQLSQQVLSDAFGNGIDSDGDGIDDTASAFLRRRLLESGPRRQTLNSTSNYIQAGIRGDIQSVVEYDLYASRANVQNVRTQEGNVSRSRFQQALLLDLQADPNGTVCQQTGSGDTDVPCAPLNIFGEGNVSPEGAAFIAGGASVASESTQSIYGARFTGKLGNLPGGKARVTLGAETRENTFTREYSTSNFSSASDLAGFNVETDLEGTTRSESIYVEVYLPLVANADGAELVDLELGYRLTDYTSAEGVASYGANASWAPTETFRVRAGYNRAHRAPSISELNTAQSESFPGAVDPCSANGIPSGGLSPEQVALCIATGVPSGLVGSPALNLPSGQVRAISGGNMDLQEEQFDTLSVGFEIAMPIGEESRFHAGADYFSIDGSGGIAPLAGGAAGVLNSCYLGGQSQGGTAQFCDVINRNSDGTIDSVELTDQNVALFNVEGVDLFAGVSLPAMGGTFGVNYNATVLDTHNYTPFEGAEALECAGKFGRACGEPMPGYNHRVSAGWSNESVAASLIWRHVGAVDDDDDSQVFAREKFNARDYLDAELSLNLADSIGLAIGIQNLTGVEPPVAGDNQEQANTFPATYDPYGRTYFVRLTGSSMSGGD